MTFAETMKMIKERIQEIEAYREHQHEADLPRRGIRRLSIARKRQPENDPADEKVRPANLTLTFRTQEERLRKLRMKAGRGQTSNVDGTHNSIKSETKPPEGDMWTDAGGVNVEMKSIHNTMFTILRDVNQEEPLFRIQNRSMKYILFVRQRHCEGHPWTILLPGETRPYCWEEPMKSKKLSVRVAAKAQEGIKMPDGASVDDKSSDMESIEDSEFMVPTEEKNTVRSARLRQALAYQYVDNEERWGFGPAVTVRLEEIGFQSFIPVPAKEFGKGKKNFLNCEVDTDGGTRILIVCDDGGPSNERGRMVRNIDILRKQILFEEERVAGLQSLRYLLSRPTRTESGRSLGNPPDSEDDDDVADAALDKERLEVIENEARGMVEDFSEDSSIMSRHQLVIEVVEAVGLSASDFIGSCNPYCEIILKGRSRSRQHAFQKRRNKRKTYFVQNSLNPKWRDQAFVFDVPEDAVRVTRGHCIQVKVRNFRAVGQHPLLGQAAVHFASLRNQQELVGWYPLSLKAGGKSDVAITADQALSDLSRGSIKLRVHWVYTLPAMLDYWMLTSERRLQSLMKTKDGMREQLEFAKNTDERKLDAKDQLQGGQITKLIKIQRRAEKRAARRDAKKQDRRVARAVRQQQKQKKISKSDKLNASTGLMALKDTLKASRERALYALHHQTQESKRSRQIDRGETSGVESFAGNLDAVGGALLPRIMEQDSSLGLHSSPKSIAETLVKKERNMPSVSPRFSDGKPKKSLDDFFAQQRSPGGIPLSTPSPHRLNLMTPSRATRRSLLETETGRRLQNQRRHSADIEDEQQVDPWKPSLLQGQALYDGIVAHAPDLGISDIMSVGTDIGEEFRRKADVMKLKSLGYVFHPSGELFHNDHLPNHFRRSLFSNAIEHHKASRLYRPKLFVGTSSAIRHFRNNQAAQAIFWNPELEVVVTEEKFLLRVKDDNTQNQYYEPPLMNPSKRVLAQKLTVPKVAPIQTKERSQYRIETMFLYRQQFDRTCRRMLGSTLHGGGWITIRPVAALNLPDTYTGMYVKASYGTQSATSETVDARVSPRWISQNFTSRPDEDVNSGDRKGSVNGPTALSPGFRFSDNDLHLHVEPHQTSGSIRLSVTAERINNKQELGVIFLPLGGAIGACIDSAQTVDMYDTDSIQGVPAYTRWFPLMDPRFATPTEGDMGLSSRPKECEQQRDNSFEGYFAPCIQLSLIWWPDDPSRQEDSDERNKPEEPTRIRGSAETARILRTPALQNYFNFDINRVSVALVDSQRAVELLNLSLVEIDVRFAVTRTKTRYGLVIGWIQLDHQDTRSREPVVLAPTPTEHVQPTLQFLALKDNLRTKSNIVSYEYIGVALQELDFTVEESWIFELWDFFMSVTRRRKVKRKSASKGTNREDVIAQSENLFLAVDLEEDTKPSLYITLQSIADRTETVEKRKMYVEHLILGLMKVNLSYVKGKKQNFELNNQGARALKNLEMKQLQSFALAANGIQFGSISKTEQSEVFTKWSQLTYDDDDSMEGPGGKSLVYCCY